eukprot:245182-Prorocentrum_minimum.AAC.1
MHSKEKLRASIVFLGDSNHSLTAGNSSSKSRNSSKKMEETLFSHTDSEKGLPRNNREGAPGVGPSRTTRTFDSSSGKPSGTPRMGGRGAQRRSSVDMQRDEPTTGGMDLYDLDQSGE